MGTWHTYTHTLFQVGKIDNEAAFLTFLWHHPETQTGIPSGQHPDSPPLHWNSCTSWDRSPRRSICHCSDLHSHLNHRKTRKNVQKYQSLIPKSVHFINKVKICTLLDSNSFSEWWLCIELSNKIWCCSGISSS